MTPKELFPGQPWNFRLSTACCWQCTVGEIHCWLFKQKDGFWSAECGSFQDEGFATPEDANIWIRCRLNDCRRDLVRLLFEKPADDSAGGDRVE
jgi:hypothetical protein